MRKKGEVSPEVAAEFDSLLDHMPVVRHLYSKRKSYAVDCTGGGPGADQSFKDESDINRIMKRFMKTGILGDPANPRQGYYGDISALPEDFMAAQATVIAAEEAFRKLPSGVRERFANNPVKMLEFLANGDNREEAIKLGLVSAPPPKDGGASLVAPAKPGTPPEAPQGAGAQ